MALIPSPHVTSAQNPTPTRPPARDQRHGLVADITWARAVSVETGVTDNQGSAIGDPQGIPHRGLATVGNVNHDSFFGHAVHSPLTEWC